jgi:hypothetical protein
MKVADFFQKARSAARNSHSEPRDVPPHQSQPNYYDDHPAAGRSRGKRTAGLTTAKLLYWLCWAAFFWFAYLNVNPYAQAASFILASISDNTLVQWFLSWPLIGPLLASLALAAHWIIGLIVWGVIQTIEVLPIILHHDRRFMRTVIAENGKAQRFAIAEDDSPTIRSLKKWYNLFPSLVVSKTRKWRKVTYAIDALICFWFILRLRVASESAVPADDRTVVRPRLGQHCAQSRDAVCDRSADPPLAVCRPDCLPLRTVVPISVTRCME